MSSGAPPSPPKVTGPIERRVDYLWQQAWQKLANGEQYAFFPAQAAAEISDLQATITNAPLATLQDFNNARRLDRSHRQSLAAHLENMCAFRDQMRSARDMMLKQVSKTNFFAFQSLSLANGAVALGTLAYFGQHTGSAPRGLVGMLVLSAIGFLLTLLSTHVAALKAPKYLELFVVLAQPNISDAVRQRTLASIPTATKELQFWPRMLSYAAAGLLIAALVLGVLSLLASPAHADNGIEPVSAAFLP